MSAMVQNRKDIQNYSYLPKWIIIYILLNENRHEKSVAWYPCTKYKQMLWCDVPDKNASIMETRKRYESWIKMNEIKCSFILLFYQIHFWKGRGLDIKIHIYFCILRWINSNNYIGHYLLLFYGVWCWNYTFVYLKQLKFWLQIVENFTKYLKFKFQLYINTFGISFNTQISNIWSKIF